MSRLRLVAEMVKKLAHWSTWVLFVALVGYYFYPEDPLPSDVHIDQIVVLKSKRQLVAYADGIPVKTYKISLGYEPIGDKQFEGDNRTPEGVYFISDKNAGSGYHKNLGISYPSEEDATQARAENREPGGDIKIHGLRNGFGALGKFHRWFDWTRGCIAMTNDEMDELYEAVDIGTTIVIQP